MGKSKKATWVAVAIGVLGLIAGGVVFGPNLYQRFFSSVTPLGTITRLEEVGTAGAPTGHRVWAVHFNPKPTEAKGKVKVFSETSFDLGQPAFGRVPNMGKSDPMRETYIVDDTGEKHGALQAQGKLLTEEVPGHSGQVSLHFRLERLIFSLPQERQPRSLQVSDGPAVRLPGAS